AIIDGGQYQHIFFPPSPHPYKMQDISITRPIHIEVKPGARVMQHHAMTNQNTSIFSFIDGSEGSVIDGGGILDGNRDALKASFGTANVNWYAISAANTAITARDLTLTEFV